MDYSGTTVLRADSDSLAPFTSQLPLWNVLPPVQLQLRCLSSRGDLLALGTQLDTVILFDRRSNDVHKICLEESGFKFGGLFGSKRREGVSVTSFSPVTPAGTTRLAVGRTCGVMHVMQFSGKDHERKTTTLPSVHEAEITTLDWDARGMMLFSADVAGHVYASHLDMQSGKHNSWLVHDARQDVLQISYSSMTLLVITAESATVCHIHQNVFERKPTRVKQERSKPLSYCGGLMGKSDGEAFSFLSCQELNFMKVSAEGQALRVSSLQPQVEYGTFDTLALVSDATTTGSHSAAAERSIQFGQVLALGSHLVTWCPTHIWLLQPSPALTVIAACTSEAANCFLDVCVDNQSIFVLRQSATSKVTPLVRLVVSQSAGASSPSRSRSASLTEPSPVASHVGMPHNAGLSNSASFQGEGSKSGTESVASGPGSPNPAPEPSGNVLQSSMTAFTDRFRNLVSISSSASSAEGVEHAAVPSTAGGSHGVALQPETSAVAAVAASTDSVDTRKQDTPAHHSVSSSASQPTEQRPPPPTQSGWLDKLRTRGGAPAAESEVTSTPSPAMPAAESRGVIRQWMTDESPSMANDDDLVVATSSAQKKKKKKKKLHKQDDPASAFSSHLSCTGRERSDSAVSEAAASDVDGGGSTSNILESSHDANAMLLAVQDALRAGDVGHTADTAAAVDEHRADVAENADVNTASLPSVYGVTEDVTFSSATTTQTSGEVTYAVATSSLQRNVAGASANMSPLAMQPSSLSAAVETVAAGPLETGPLSDHEDGDEVDVAPRARAVSELSSADDVLTGSLRSEHDDADDTTSNDIVLQNYDESLPAHIVQHASEESCQGSPDTRKRYNSRHSASLDSACRLSPPSRRQLHCLAMSKQHIWIADSGEYIYCWSVDTSAWVNIKGAYAIQLATCVSSDLLWSLSRHGIVSARVGITEGMPLGRAWVKLEKLRLKCIAIGGSTAWLVARDGRLMRRKNLSYESPLGEKWQDEESTFSNSIVQLAAGTDVLWALTAQGSLLVRQGITESCPLGDKWLQVGDGDNDRLLSISISPNGYGWAVNAGGVACFMAGVTSDNPTGGSEGWWQVSLGQQLMKESSILSTIKDASSRVTALWSHKSTGQYQPVKMVSSSDLGIGVVTSSGLLYSCGDMTGMQFKPPHIGSLAKSSIWLAADASAAYESSGLVWLLSPTGEIFSLPRGGRPAAMTVPDDKLIQRLSASNRGVLSLSGDGVLYMRTGVNEYCPAGTSWRIVEVPHSMPAPVSVSSGNTAVWLVDSKGDAWTRACDGEDWRDDWLCVGRPGHSKLVQVVVGPGDWHVWACDSSGAVHVRTGVSIDVICGTEWESAPDVDVTDVAISTNGVWARCTNGDIVWRSNVSPSNPVGDYWRRIPGSFAAVSSTPDDDELWVLNDDGQLFIRQTSIYQAAVQVAKSSPSLPHQAASLDTWEVL